VAVLHELRNAGDLGVAHIRELRDQHILQSPVMMETREVRMMEMATVMRTIVIVVCIHFCSE
jgi:hypothetical protein